MKAKEKAVSNVKYYNFDDRDDGGGCAAELWGHRGGRKVC